MISRDVILDDISKTKVCLIEDIAKLYRLYSDKTISVKVFDILYDMSVPELDVAFRNCRDLLEQKAAVKHHERNF